MNSSIEMLWLHSVAFGFTGGTILGLVFFLGLWLTVQRMTLHQAGAMLFISSLIIRTGFVSVGFFVILRGFEWQGLLSAVAAFIMVRIFLAQLLTRRPLTHVKSNEYNS